jgi:hypothetical protein
MSNVVIHGEGLGKRYSIGHAERYSTLRDVLARSLRPPWTLFRRAKNETFWALKDVSLEVHEAEVLGLIGRNGAGKTTLLKILSRITRPTTGWAEIHGRVGSLLEVGTGFHPELTGRENTFLSGAILGMGKAEIARKFDEIVAFAELEKFIDTPVKHYSSGTSISKRNAWERWATWRARAAPWFSSPTSSTRSGACATAWSGSTPASCARTVRPTKWYRPTNRRWPEGTVTAGNRHLRQTAERALSCGKLRALPKIIPTLWQRLVRLRLSFSWRSILLFRRASMG